MNKLPPVTMNQSTVLHEKRAFRRPLLVASLAGIAVLAVACTSTQSASTANKGTPAGSGISSQSIKLAPSTLAGVGSVLTGPNGMTLYYFTADS